MFYISDVKVMDFMATASEAQLERDFKERITAANAKEANGIGDSITEHVNDLQLDQILYLKGLCKKINASEHAEVSKELEPLVQEDIPALRDAMVSDLSGHDLDHDITLSEQDALIKQHAALFAQLDLDSNWSSLQPRYQAFLEAWSDLKDPLGGG
jgi:hypothetical protein